MRLIKKYRVKVVIDNHSAGLRSLTTKEPETKYVIQERFIVWWMNESTPTTNKDWAYRTCDEMNMPYDKAKKEVIKTYDA